jgi:hypothetical protein
LFVFVFECCQQLGDRGAAGRGLDEAALAVRLSRLRNAATLLSYNAVLADALQAMQQLHLVAPSDEDVVALGELLGRLTHLNTVRLGHTELLLTEMRAHLHGLDVAHLQLVAAMARSHQVCNDHPD